MEKRVYKKEFLEAEENLFLEGGSSKPIQYHILKVTRMKVVRKEEEYTLFEMGLVNPEDPKQIERDFRVFSDYIANPIPLIGIDGALAKVGLLKSYHNKLERNVVDVVSVQWDYDSVRVTPKF